MPSRKILTPMWVEGEKVYTMRHYQETVSSSSNPTRLKRIWVGLDKSSVSQGVVDKKEVEDWIFDDGSQGYEEVKRYNLGQDKA